MKDHIQIGIIILFILGLFACENKEKNETPNVVLIFADDVGYGDLGCYGAKKLNTPNLDLLAKEGRRFTDAHSVSAVCTPSRYGLITGQYPFRANDGKGVWGPLGFNSKLIIDTTKLTIGKLMKQQGYVTAAIGKWHLGFGNETPTNWNEKLSPGPLELGFDYYFGVPFVNSGPPYVYVENDRVVGLEADDPMIINGKPISETPLYPDKSPNRFSGGKKAHAIYDDEKTGTLLAEKATQWIAKNKEKPFFLYLATTNIHHPFSAHERFKGSSESGRYGDFVHELDWMVGEVINSLKKAGIEDNTLIIFTSDNGGMLNVGGQEAWKLGHRMNGELLGFKFDAWEGGHRVPFIARWPGNIEANTVSDQLISNIDFLATLAGITGYELKNDEALDSYNMIESLTGNPEEQMRDHLVIAPFRKSNLSIRKGKWMYISGRGGGGWNGGKPGSHILGGPPALKFANESNSDIEAGAFKEGIPPDQLYNLEDDISQTVNVVNDFPKKADELRKLLKTIRASNGTRKGINESN